MIDLNKNNGHFLFKKFIVKPTDKIQGIKNEFAQYELELWFENEKWVSYRLDIAVDLILLFRFYNFCLSSIEIYLKDKAGHQRESQIRVLLNDLGGVNEYPWGNVELNMDNKAGYQSILINYDT